MKKKVSEAYPELYHYTTARGLDAIAQTQKLRATHSSYLNDAEEQIGFFERRLPSLLKQAAETAVASAMLTIEGRANVAERGGKNATVDGISNGMLEAIKKTALEHDHPYIASFCSPPTNRASDGLLSQWRGYGHDGGYAVVFETAGIEALMSQETADYCYQFAAMADVEYYDQDTAERATHPETLAHEATIRDVVERFVMSGDRALLAELATPVTSLSCLTKHAGFAEEREVRIVALLPQGRMLDAARASGDSRPVRPIGFDPKNGLLIPHIFLFEAQVESKSVLPIKRVIVGPHRNQEGRRKAAELLLHQRNISAEVVNSDIPYLGL